MFRKSSFVLYYVLVYASIGCRAWINQEVEPDLVNDGKCYKASAGDNIHPMPQGFVETANTLLKYFKAGRIHNVETLNIFKRGLTEYFLFFNYIQALSQTTVDANPCRWILNPLHNIKKEIRPFSYVQVFGFPGFEAKDKPDISFDRMGSDMEIKINVTYKSDKIAFTGDFDIHNSSYLFTYRFKQNIVTQYMHYSMATFDIHFIERSWEFKTEELLHSFESSLPRYNETVEILAQQFKEVLKMNYLKILMYRNRLPNYSTVYPKITEFLLSHRDSILSALIKLATQYGKAKGLNAFEAPVSSTTYANGTLHNWLYQRIKIEGLFNFVDYKLLNSSDNLEFTYSAIGDKQAFVSFIKADDKTLPDAVSKYTIRNIQIKIATIKEFDVASRIDEMFHRSTEFLVDFQVDNLGEDFRLILKHFSRSHISYAIRRTVMGNEFGSS